MMTDEQEYAARSQLKWRRDGNAWVAALPSPPHGPRRARHVRFEPQPSQGSDARPSRSRARLGACKSPLKMPSKTGCIFGRSLAHALFRWGATPFASQRIR